jgi:hypothetical protein
MLTQMLWAPSGTVTSVLPRNVSTLPWAVISSPSTFTPGSDTCMT